MTQNKIRDDRKSLFTSQIPLRKSYILSDIFLGDQNNSITNSRFERNLSTHSIELKKSLLTTSKILYPGSNFIVKKLKRIIHSHLRNIFIKLKKYRKVIIHLNLIKSIHSRFLSCSFFNIKCSLHSYRDQKLETKIQRTKQPILIFYAILRMIRNKNRKSFQEILNFGIKNKYKLNLINKLDKAVTQKIKPAWFRIFIRQVKRRHQQQANKVHSCKKLNITSQVITRRFKQFSLNKLVEYLKIMQHDDTNQQKKLTQMKLTQNQIQKARALTNQRKKLRGMKNQLQIFSTDTSKTRYGIRRNLNVYRNTMKDQEKKAKKQIDQLNHEIQLLEIKLKQSSKISNYRLFRTQLSVSESKVKQLYKSLYHHQTGSITSPLLTKTQLESYQQQISQINEFHVYQNQKLRQLLGEYQNLTIFNNLLPDEEQFVQQENKYLKEIIHCLCFRNLDKFAHNDLQCQIDEI